jgi:hypothetical protein
MAMGKKLRDRLLSRVKAEQGNMKQLLREIAETKAKASTAAL